MVAQFVAITGFLGRFQASGTDFDQKGVSLIAYHLCRVGLLANLLVLCHSAGYYLFWVWRIELPRRMAVARRAFVLCFFVGASAYGLVFAALGLAEMLRPMAALVLTIPVLLASFRPLAALATFNRANRDCYLNAKSGWRHWLTWFLAAVAVVSVVLFVVLRVLFIPAADGNIWEHYLHYYRLVLQTGSTQPNEVWHHFYNSKGGGLVFLAGLLSDCFAVQLVSGIFLIAAAIVIYDLLHKYSRSIRWALLGVILYFAFLAGDYQSGAMFRVHGVILGYATFAFWGCIWLARATVDAARPILLALCFCLYYFGFYQPVATAIFPAAFVLVALAERAMGDRVKLHRSMLVAMATVCGTASVVLINWIITGLPEITPMRLLWKVADQAKVARVFGTGGVDFFLAVDNDLGNPTPWYERALWALRQPVSHQVTILTAIGLLTLAVIATRSRRAGKRLTAGTRLVVECFAYMVPLGAFSVLIASPSLYRMSIYGVVFVIIGMVVAWKAMADVVFGAKHPFAIALIMILGSASSITRAVNMLTPEERGIVGGLVVAKLSLKEAVERMEAPSIAPQAVSVPIMSKVRRIIGPETRILALTNDAGYSYFFPDGGVVSEPTYAIVDDPYRMAARSPSEVASYLQARKIDYLLINLKSRLFSGLAFSSLLDPEEASRYLSVSYRYGDIFVLSLRQEGQGKPLPRYLLTVFELKRTGALHFPFSNQVEDVGKLKADLAVNTRSQYEQAILRFVRDMTAMYEKRALAGLALDSSKELMRRTLRSGLVAVEQLGSDLWSKELASAGRLRSQLDNELVDDGSSRLSNDLAAEFLNVFRKAVYQEYVTELGPSIADLVSTHDERAPFAVATAISK